MPTETKYGAGGKVTSHHIGADKSDADIADAQSRSAAQDTTRLKAKSESGFPKRSDYGSQEEYTSAIKAFRNKAAGQRDALIKK